MQQFFLNLQRVALIFIISVSAFGRESLSPHIHGEAGLHIIMDGSKLLVELNSPAMNLLGFEHAIHNSEDQAMVENTRVHLKNPNALFILNDGKCQLKEQAVDFSNILKASEHKHHETHGQDNDPHTNSHKDIEATYLYLCEEPNNLHSARVLLLDVFPNITSLHVQWIIHNQQGENTLNHKHNDITFR